MYKLMLTCKENEETKRYEFISKNVRSLQEFLTLMFYIDGVGFIVKVK